MKAAPWHARRPVPLVEDWKMRAACAGTDVTLFYPEVGDTPVMAEVIDAYCRRCPVLGECAEAGRLELYGVWGGLTPAQRRRDRLREIGCVDLSPADRAR